MTFRNKMKTFIYLNTKKKCLPQFQSTQKHTQNPHMKGGETYVYTRKVILFQIYIKS